MANDKETEQPGDQLGKNVFKINIFGVFLFASVLE